MSLKTFVEGLNLCEFKLGDEVISKHYGVGSIVEIDEQLALHVIFEGHTYVRWFLPSGQNRIGPLDEDLSITLRNAKKPFEFQVGDIVEFGGLEGVVNVIASGDMLNYPLECSFEKGLAFYCFTIDGRSHKKHTKPLLNFIRRKEEKIELSAEEIVDAIREVVMMTDDGEEKVSKLLGFKEGL